ncbi:MAG: hypothetical protein LUH21_04155 [Clostridiales bacterium]|nr:hypothetical protein [Clostridiales bacterium]
MTKTENSKCVTLLYEAITAVQNANEEYKENENTENNGVEREIKQRQADQHYGYAEGIFHTLLVLNFKHEDMEQLRQLLK